MLRLDSDSVPNSFKLFIWLLMSFQAGYVNVGGFLIFGNFVSHVTGTSSQIGMGMAAFDWQQILTFLVILISFIGGSAFVGHFIGRKTIEGKVPSYVLVTGVKAFIFSLVLIISEHHYEDFTYKIELLLVLLLSLASGIQNATCALATNGFLKPTHMTGLSTDIGINLLRLFGHNRNSEEFKEERRKNNIRLGILGSFISGGAIAYFIFSQNGHYGFLFPFVSSVWMFVTTIALEKSEAQFERRLKWARSSIFGVFATTLIFGVINIINSY